MAMQVFSNGIRVPVYSGRIIEEFIGIKRGQEHFSVTHMIMSPNWSESPHGTEFDEIVIVVKGKLTVTHNRPINENTQYKVQLIYYG